MLIVVSSVWLEAKPWLLYSLCQRMFAQAVSRVDCFIILKYSGEGLIAVLYMLGPDIQKLMRESYFKI